LRDNGMDFPLSFGDISIWLAVTATILLITSELISPHYGKRNLLIDRKRLRNMALTMSILFLITVAIQIYEIIKST
jgi:heme exporter protein D